MLDSLLLRRSPLLLETEAMRRLGALYEPFPQPRGGSNPQPRGGSNSTALPSSPSPLSKNLLDNGQSAGLIV